MEKFRHNIYLIQQLHFIGNRRGCRDNGIVPLTSFAIGFRDLKKCRNAKDRNRTLCFRPLLPAFLFFFFLAGAVLADNGRTSFVDIAVSGVVTSSEDGSPLPGVSVAVKGGSAGTVTDASGRFQLTVPEDAILLVRYIGYVAQEVHVNGRAQINITLALDQKQLSEVVVTALGIKREKRQLTYSTQQIQSEVLTTTKEPNVLNAMAGRASGVQITSSTGQPGSSSRIVIRGTSSLLGDNQALIVLDGVPINNSETGNAGEGAGVSRLSDIDPSIIESVNILKGSAASALYGSKAARGVVMITTKNGSADRKPRISFSSQFSIENPILPKLQDKYAQGENGVYFNGEDQKTSLVWGPLISSLGEGVYNKNPMEEFFVTGKTFTNTISVDGGTEKSDYFLSFTNLDQSGTVPTTSFKRNGFFGKYTSQITDKLSSTFQINYTASANHRVPEGSTLVSPLWTVYTAPFTWNPQPYLEENGTQRVFRYSRNNPYWVLDNVSNDSKVDRFIPMLTLSYNPLSWLSITERIGADIYAEEVKYYEAPSSALATRGTIIDGNNNFRQFNHDLIVQASKNFGDDWSLSLLLGNNLLSTYSQNMRIAGTGISIDGFKNVSNSERQISSQNEFLQRKVGFYAQSNIEYKFLNLSLTGRYDGSSVLAEGQNFYPYGSASLGFMFTELVNLPAVDFGKLRVSYSSVGNDNISPYSLTTPYQTAPNFPFNGRGGFLLSTTLGNPGLRDEQTKEFEVGLETNLFKGRVGLEISYFRRNHLDLLTANIPISAATGFTSTTLNAGDMINKGVEALLNITPVETPKFRWDMTMNYTKIKNEVTRIYGDQDRLQIGETWAFVGDPYGTFFNYGYARNDEGRILIDANGLPRVSPTLVKIGNIQPDWLGGVTNTLRYDKFALSFFFDVRKGGDVYNSDERYGYFYGTPKVTEQREPRVIPGVSAADGSENTIEVSAYNHYQRLNLIHESVIQDGTFVKLRNASLSYNFSNALLQRTPFSNASLSLTGRNLWIYAPNFTGSDPEVSTGGASNGAQGMYANPVPTSRSFNLTLNVAF